MSLTNIIDKIRSDAQREADAIEANARAEAEKIVAKAREEAQAEADVIMERAEAEHEVRAARILSAKRTEIKKELLSARQAEIDAVLADVLHYYEQMESEAYTKFVSGLILENALGDEELIMEAQYQKKLPADFLQDINQKLVSSGRKGMLRLGKTEAELGPGLVLSRGKVLVNCTVPKLLAQQKDELRAETAKILF